VAKNVFACGKIGLPQKHTKGHKKIQGNKRAFAGMRITHLSRPMREICMDQVYLS
jgi:hypothetical protein